MQVHGHEMFYDGRAAYGLGGQQGSMGPLEKGYGATLKHKVRSRDRCWLKVDRRLQQGMVSGVD